MERALLLLLVFKHRVEVKALEIYSVGHNYISIFFTQMKYLHIQIRAE